MMRAIAIAVDLFLLWLAIGCVVAPLVRADG